MYHKQPRETLSKETSRSSSKQSLPSLLQGHPWDRRSALSPMGFSAHQSPCDEQQQWTQHSDWHRNDCTGIDTAGITACCSPWTPLTRGWCEEWHPLEKRTNKGTAKHMNWLSLNWNNLEVLFQAKAIMDWNFTVHIPAARNIPLCSPAPNRPVSTPWAVCLVLLKPVDRALHQEGSTSQTGWGQNCKLGPPNYPFYSFQVQNRYSLTPKPTLTMQGQEKVNNQVSSHSTVMELSTKTH